MTRTRILPAVFAAGFALATLSRPVPAQVVEAPKRDTPGYARAVARSLDAGRVTEAVAEARRAVEEFPKEALLHRRLAQAHLCGSLQLDTEFGAVLDAARQAQMLAKGVSSLQRKAEFSDPRDQALIPLVEQSQAEARQKLLTAKNLAYVQQVQTLAREALENCGPLLARRGKSLQEALRATETARQLGDRSTELELTGLWARTAVLFWREQHRALQHPEARLDRPFVGRAVENPVRGSLAEVEKALAPFAGVTAEAVLQRASELARARPGDPEALAGAADVLIVVSDLTRRPDPLRRYVKEMLDRLPRAMPRTSKDEAQQLYLAARDEQADEKGAAPEPGLAALRLYLRALRLDPKGTLPYLPLRVYPVLAAFDPEQAEKLIEDLWRREPWNTAVALEHARGLLLASGRHGEGMARLREAADLRRFSRSFLAAVPPPLRTTLKFHPVLRELAKDGWPGFRWVFDMYRELQRPVSVRGSQLVPLPEPEVRGRIQVLAARLRLAERLCAAPDYPDQALGIHERSQVLEEIVRLAERLSPEEQERWNALQAEHARTFGGFPRMFQGMRLHEGGLQYTLIL